MNDIASLFDRYRPVAASAVDRARNSGTWAAWLTLAEMQAIAEEALNRAIRSGFDSTQAETFAGYVSRKVHTAIGDAARAKMQPRVFNPS